MVLLNLQEAESVAVLLMGRLVTPFGDAVLVKEGMFLHSGFIFLSSLFDCGRVIRIPWQKGFYPILHLATISLQFLG